MHTFLEPYNPACRKKRQALGLTYPRSSCDKCGSLVRAGWKCAEETEDAAEKKASSSYQLGWDDGYAEGYAVKLVDATEPFNPPSNEFQIEAAAEHLYSRLSAYIDYPAAIGLVRGMLKAGKNNEGL